MRNAPYRSFYDLKEMTFESSEISFYFYLIDLYIFGHII